MSETTAKVYAAISAVSHAMLGGISKSSKNQQQGFMFRGVDSVYNALAPALVEHKLVILPRMISRSATERATKNGGLMSYVIVQAEFDFVSAEDGSKVTIAMFGEGSDSGDKATNKAMSIAYKYACFQAFCIPTEDTTVDPDATAVEFAPSASRNPHNTGKQARHLAPNQITELENAIVAKGYTVQSACDAFKVRALAELEQVWFADLMQAVRMWPEAAETVNSQ